MILAYFGEYTHTHTHTHEIGGVEGAGVLAHNDDTKGPEACLHLKSSRRRSRRCLHPNDRS